MNTGIAVASTGAAAELSLALRDQAGNIVAGGTRSIALKANGHVARFIEELFPLVDTSDFTGTVTVSAVGSSIAGIAIQLGSRPGEITTLPVTALR